jgi:signal transduction histidine kinase
VHGDHGRLAQVVDNLLANALKFTAPDGSIDVILSVRGDRARIEVRDTGVGIPPAVHGRLFERFFRASNATEQETPGAGLGLTIVKAIVEAHGGRVGVESSERVGTTFSVDLPRVIDRTAAAAAA